MTISRFQVMATLQAARARTLGLAESSAYSWGLNRAIFYAAAKRGFKGGLGGGGGKSHGDAGREKLGLHEEEYYLGNDKAFIDKDAGKAKQPIFIIGDSAQKPEDFEKQIVARFGTRANFEKAWEEAMKIIQKYDKATLESPEEFFDKVYKPRRDALSKEWTEKFTSKKK